MTRLLVLVAVVSVCGCGDSASGGDCQDGDTRSCYSGPPGTEGVGTCAPGLETCVDGQFNGICLGDVTPFVEHCDGVDEDCDGEVDDVAEAGAPCTSADGCDGARACVGDVVECVAPDRNACDVCGGPAVADVGTTCTVGNCTGQLVCTTEGDATSCNAPAENACGLCGGPTVNGLGDACAGAAACPGIEVCNTAGNGTVCDCNPQPGECRDTGVFRPVVAPVAGDLVITELMPNPSGNDNLQEWFEVEVVNDVDLNQLELDRVGDTRASDVIAAVDCIRVTAGTRLVFARSADPAFNGGLPQVDGLFTFALVAGSVASPGDIRLVANGNLVDAVTWTSSPSAKSLQLDPDLVDPVANDNQSNFCNATTTYNGGADLGTPGGLNGQCAILPPPGHCNVGAGNRVIKKPSAGDLVITEWLPNPSTTGADSTQEWFEITNVSNSSFDINELGLDREGDTRAPDVVSIPDCVAIAPGGFALFARSNDPNQNAGLPAVDATFGFSLVDSNGNIQVLDGVTVLDKVTWTSSSNGISQQVDPAHQTTTDNDSAANICGGNVAYGDGTNQGTPKAANHTCP